jgi:6-pyruvoyltetrahydropterin/6-carboxytetrahydropterin synthase
VRCASSVSGAQPSRARPWYTRSVSASHRASYRIEVARELFKFSCAHMTVFPDGTKERLHGHNYMIGLTLELRDIAFDKMIPFEHIKQAGAALCQEWKEHLLLAVRNPHFELVRDDGHEIEFRLCGARYVVPRGDVVLLPIDNVATEPLAAHAADLILARLGSALRPDVVTAIELSITESPGQGAVCRRDLSAAAPTPGS